jgi:hypothetical protein
MRTHDSLSPKTKEMITKGGYSEEAIRRMLAPPVDKKQATNWYQKKGKWK